MRVEIARREAGAIRQARLELQDAHVKMGETLNAEIDGCDSIERAPFDFAARYYRASIDRMQHKEEKIGVAARKEIDASEALRERYREQKEFDVFVSRRQREYDHAARQDMNERSRQYSMRRDEEFA